MQHGWIKLYRRALGSKVFGDGGLWQTWCYCLLEAAHEDAVVRTPVGPLEVKAGSFITGRYKMADAMNVKPSTAWKRLQRLARLGQVTLSSNTRCTVVSVCNWGRYQDRAQAEEHKVVQPRVPQGVPQGVPPGDTLQEEKEPQEPKKKKASGGVGTAPLALDSPENFRRLWNEMVGKTGGNIPCIRRMTKKREDALRARLKEEGWRDDYREALEKIPGSAFLTGQTDRGTWKANAEWFLKPGHMENVLEGNYDDDKGVSSRFDFSREVKP